MTKTLLLSTTALVLMATAAAARLQVVLGRDSRIVTLASGAAFPHTAKSAPAGEYLYTNLALKEKKGLYLASPIGFTISGPSSILGQAIGIAEQFRLKVHASATSLAAAVGYVSGDNSVTLTLYADNGSNAPGAVLASGTGTTTIAFGFCCDVTRVSIAPTRLHAKRPYWIGITTTGSNFEAAGPEIANQVNDYAYLASTSDGGESWSAGNLSFATQLPAIGID